MTTLAAFQEHLRHLVETTEMDADRRPELTYHLDRNDWATLIRHAIAIVDCAQAAPGDDGDTSAIRTDSPEPKLSAKLMAAIVERALSVPEAQETREFVILHSLLVGVVFDEEERDRIVEMLLRMDWLIPQEATDRLFLNVMFHSNASVRWDLIRELLHRGCHPSEKALHEVEVTLKGEIREVHAAKSRAMVEAAKLQEQLGRERPSHARRPDGSDTAMGTGL